MYALLEKAYLEKENSFPTWLSPVQARLIPVSDKFVKQVEKIADQIGDEGIRVDIDDRRDSVPKKIRSAELEWIPYIIVIGEKEIKSKKIALRDRKTGKTTSVSASALIKKIKKETGGKPYKKLPLPRKLSNRPSFGASG
jgi:threonyl-tRNA synthetase